MTCTGRLASVGNVSVLNGSNTILLSWSPPFSLDVTGVDLDIWYTVLISNVTDEDDSRTFDEYSNLTQPYFEFNTTFPSPYHKFSFVIIPHNGAGAGNRSDPVIGAFISGTCTCMHVYLHVFRCRCLALPCLYD